MMGQTDIFLRSDLVLKSSENSGTSSEDIHTICRVAEEQDPVIKVMCNDMHATGAQEIRHLVISNLFSAFRWLAKGDAANGKTLGLRSNGRT